MDWAPGDLALCINDGDWIEADGVVCGGPHHGQLLEVVEVELCPPAEAPPEARHTLLMLGFAPWPDNTYWAGAFTKITPLTDDERREFEADLRHDQREPLTLLEDLLSWAGRRLP